jgi:hypothetical protein
MKTIRLLRPLGIVASLALVAVLGIAAEKKATKKAAAKNAPAAALPSPVSKRWDLVDGKLHRDFPAMALAADGTPWIAFIEHDGKAELKFAMNGTAPIKRVTIVRNERNHQVFEPGKRDFETTFTDAAPLAGENRYYLRVEQTDGNMAWSSPVWVTVKSSESAP